MKSQGSLPMIPENRCLVFSRLNVYIDIGIPVNWSLVHLQPLVHMQSLYSFQCEQPIHVHFPISCEELPCQLQQMWKSVLVKISLGASLHISHCQTVKGNITYLFPYSLILLCCQQLAILVNSGATGWLPMDFLEMGNKMGQRPRVGSEKQLA